MRWLFRVVVFLATLGFLALFALALVPGQKLADMAAERLTELTGREVVLEGDVKTGLFPHLSVTTGAVTVANADWSNSGPMLTAEGLSVGVSMWPLLSGEVRIREIAFVRPKILLETSADGMPNWEFFTSKPAASGGDVPSSKSPSDFTVDIATVSGAEVVWLDHQKGMRETLSSVDLSLEFPHLGGAISAEGSGIYAGTVFKFNGSAPNAQELLTGKVSPLVAAAQFGGAKADFDGKLGLSNTEFDGQLSVAVADFSTMSGVIGGDALDLNEPVKLVGKAIRTSDGAFFLRDGEISVGANSITGNLDLVPGDERPMLKATLVADRLDFSKSKATNAANGGGAKKQSGWPRSHINSSVLFLSDAEVSLSTNSLDFGGLKLGQNQILMRLDAGRAVFSLANTAAYDGALSGEFVMNGRGGLSVGGNLAASDVSIEPLLTDLADMERFSGKGDFSVKFLGVGNTVDAIMHSLSGEGQVALRNGALKGVDLKQMIAKMDADQQGDGKRTVFDSLNASFVMADGIAKNDDLDIRANGFTAVGKGEVNLGEQTLDFRVTPTALVREDGTGGVKVPVRIKGPWAGPRYFLDVEALSAQELDIDRETLEQNVKDARKNVKENAAKQLGIKQRKGESLEDAARRTLEEAATKELLKIFGKN